jgi:hypothetical protein
MVILYSVLNPLKDLSKAGYNIPKGLASMERIDKIMNAENNIKESARPAELKGFDGNISSKAYASATRKADRCLQTSTLPFLRARWWRLWVSPDPESLLWST